MSKKLARKLWKLVLILEGKTVDCYAKYMSFQPFQAKYNNQKCYRETSRSWYSTEDRSSTAIGGDVNLQELFGNTTGLCLIHQVT